jgi:hypothetical protein
MKLATFWVVGETVRRKSMNENRLRTDQVGMKRFLIFPALFPPLALVIFNLPDIVARHDFKMLDFVYFGMAYTFGIIPALVLAGIDRKFHSLVWTTIAGALMTGSLLFFLWGGFRELFPALMALLLGGGPAAVCSWVSDKSMRGQNV